MKWTKGVFAGCLAAASFCNSGGVMVFSLRAVLESILAGTRSANRTPSMGSCVIRLKLKAVESRAPCEREFRHCRRLVPKWRSWLGVSLGRHIGQTMCIRKQQSPCAAARKVGDAEYAIGSESAASDWRTLPEFSTIGESEGET